VLTHVTLRLPQCLDEIQAHIVLKRWLKDSMEKQVSLAKDKDGQFLLGTDTLIEVLMPASHSIPLECHHTLGSNLPVPCFRKLLASAWLHFTAVTAGTWRT
jgi:hypothetical protein